jgi:DNA-binding NarL/FixJ family response regulator
MTGFQKYDALLVDPDIQSRMRLKQATTAVTNFGKVLQVGSFKEAQDKLRATTNCDVVFISYKLDMPDITGFVKAAKETPQARDAAYILVLGGKDQDSSTVATSVISGFDGMLFEPYSVDNLLEITEIAARVRKERSRAREEAAIRLLVSDLMNQLDFVAYLKKSQGDSGRVLKKFKETCAVLKTLSPESLAIYSSLAVDMFEQAPLPKKVFQRKNYSGASSRVKKKMEDKLLAELGKDTATDAKA